MAQATQKTAKDKPPENIPGAPEPEAPKPWDRKCQVCGSRCGMESAEVYNEENFECLNLQCRARYRVRTFYGKGGVFLREEFDGMTEGPINGN